MPMDRKLKWPGDLYILRNDGTALSQAIVGLSGGNARHIGVYGEEDFCYEENPPCASRKTMTELGHDDLFDRGLLCHIRPARQTQESLLRMLGWVQTRTGDAWPYGYETIGDLAFEDFIGFPLPGLEEFFKHLPSPADWQHEQICSIYAWLATSYGQKRDFAAAWGYGPGQL